MKTKYLMDFFPNLLEKEIEKVEIQEFMDVKDQEVMKDEVGKHLFGDEFNDNGLGNPELPAIMAGRLGSEVRKWKKGITTKVLQSKWK